MWLLCPSIPNLKLYVGRDGIHYNAIVVGPSCVALFRFRFPDSNIPFQEPLAGSYALYCSRRENSHDQ